MNVTTLSQTLIQCESMRTEGYRINSAGCWFESNTAHHEKTPSRTGFLLFLKA
jgi:hypothetical protein